jgi:DNA-directed RNA polymerase subunit RPC12/RpoP
MGAIALCLQLFTLKFYKLNVNIDMFVTSFKENYKHTRVSKLGKEHSYMRHKTVLVFRCDDCDAEFIRDRAMMDPKRISNNYFHVCSSCDSKRFAQKKGVEKRLIWDLPASSTLPIGRY